MEPNPEMDYGDALVLAMKMEKASFRLYSDLAESTNDATLAGTLRALAQEEAKHKLRFELEYDDYAQRDN
jgi:rubrerythrin